MNLREVSMNARRWIVRSVFVPLAVAANMALATATVGLLSGVVAL